MSTSDARWFPGGIADGAIGYGREHIDQSLAPLEPVVGSGRFMQSETSVHHVVSLANRSVPMGADQANGLISTEPRTFTDQTGWTTGTFLMGLVLGSDHGRVKPVG